MRTVRAGTRSIRPLSVWNSGQVLAGIMTLTAQSASGFSYNCQFQGVANTGLPIQNVEQLTWCAQTLEAYSVQRCSHYPGLPAHFHAQYRHSLWSYNTGNCVDRPEQCDGLWPALRGCRSNSASTGEVNISYENFAVALTRVASAACNSDGRLEVFGVGTDHAVWHNWQTVAHAGPWSGWASLGGVVTSDPSVFENSDGRLEVFAAALMTPSGTTGKRRRMRGLGRAGPHWAEPSPAIQ